MTSAVVSFIKYYETNLAETMPRTGRAPANAWNSSTAPRQGRIKGATTKHLRLIKRSMVEIMNDTFNSGLLWQWLNEIPNPKDKIEVALRIANKFIPDLNKQEGGLIPQKQGDLNINIVQIMDKYGDKPPEVIEVQGMATGCVQIERAGSEGVHQDDAKTRSQL